MAAPDFASLPLNVLEAILAGGAPAGLAEIDVATRDAYVRLLRQCFSGVHRLVAPFDALAAGFVDSQNLWRAQLFAILKMVQETFVRATEQVTTDDYDDVERQDSWMFQTAITRRGGSGGFRALLSCASLSQSRRAAIIAHSEMNWLGREGELVVEIVARISEDAEFKLGTLRIFFNRRGYLNRDETRSYGDTGIERFFRIGGRAPGAVVITYTPTQAITDAFLAIPAVGDFIRHAMMRFLLKSVPGTVFAAPDPWHGVQTDAATRSVEQMMQDAARTRARLLRERVHL